MKDVANCPRCGNIFIKALRPICQQCYKEQEEKYDMISKFMRKRENRMATMQEVHEKTEVELQLIHQFVREGRLLATHFPNFGYPCESCNTLIQKGRICVRCKDQITNGLAEIEKEKEFVEKVSSARKEENARAVTYHSLNDRIK
ncbi:hypothetical protein GN156_05640 [bacterium LRH843]|nr:hypothetical protein [bacterium LRH843]